MNFLLFINTSHLAFHQIRESVCNFCLFCSVICPHEIPWNYQVMSSHPIADKSLNGVIDDSDLWNACLDIQRKIPPQRFQSVFITHF